MGEGHAFGLYQPDEQRRIIVAGGDLLDPRKRGGPWEAPRVNMEHGSDRHIDVVAMEAALLRRKTKHSKLRHCMQHKLTVAVVDAFRQPRSSGSIESCRLDVLVEVRELEVRRCGREQLLILANEFEVAGHRRFAVSENDQPLDLRQLRQDRLYEVDELVIDEQRR